MLYYTIWQIYDMAMHSVCLHFAFASQKAVYYLEILWAYFISLVVLPYRKITHGSFDFLKKDCPGQRANLGSFGFSLFYLSQGAPKTAWLLRPPPGFFKYPK